MEACYDFKFYDKNTGIILTNDTTANTGLIDTGFTGSLLFPSKEHKEKFKANNERVILYYLANGKEIKFNMVEVAVWYVGSKSPVLIDILIGDVSQPIMGIEFLETFEKIVFDFDRKTVYY